MDGKKFRLEPCPFPSCGSDEVELIGMYGMTHYCVRCDACNAHRPSFSIVDGEDFKEKALNAWNLRKGKNELVL